MNKYTHYTSPLGNDCYAPNFNSNVSRITVWNKETQIKRGLQKDLRLEITVEYLDGELIHHKYSEFEAVMNAVEGGETYGE